MTITATVRGDGQNLRGILRRAVVSGAAGENERGASCADVTHASAAVWIHIGFGTLWWLCEPPRRWHEG
jgi:hypothetical protein